jgi:hypothetical protein
MTDPRLPRISGQELLDAIRQGVHDAFWEMITNATSCPCGDFYEHVKAGVKEAVSEAAAGWEPPAGWPGPDGSS